MPSGTPAPGRSGAPPRRGIGGVLGLLAVLAFVILAAVIVTRREPDRVADVPPTAPPAAPTTTLAPPPSEPPPSAAPVEAPLSTAPPTAVVDATPTGPAAPPSRPGKLPRPSRRTGATPDSGAATAADAEAAMRRGPGSLPPTGTASRRFVLGTTSIESLKPVLRDLKGFEADNVGVKRAPEVNGRVELEMDPATVRPGVDYTVKVYLANDGAKDIPVQEMQILTVENGKASSRTLPPRARSVRPQQRVLLGEISGVWREVMRTWAMDVVVTSGRQDVYRNRLQWE